MFFFKNCSDLFTSKLVGFTLLSKKHNKFALNKKMIFFLVAIAIHEKKHLVKVKLVSLSGKQYIKNTQNQATILGKCLSLGSNSSKITHNQAAFLAMF